MSEAKPFDHGSQASQDGLNLSSNLDESLPTGGPTAHSSQAVPEKPQAQAASPGDGTRHQEALPESDGDGDLESGGTALETRLDQALLTGAPDASVDAMAIVERKKPAGYLVIVRGDLAGKTLPLLGGPVWILGRSESAALTLQSKAVSLEHARIEQVEERFRLVDLDSTNGTQLNGRAVLRPVYLRAGDTIEIADTALVFLTRDADEMNATVPIRTGGGLPRTPIVRLPQDTWSGPGGLVYHHAGNSSPAQWGRTGSSSDEDDVDSEEQGTSLADLLRKLFGVLELLRRHWRKLLALPALCGALGLATLLVKPPPSEIEFELGIQWQQPENPLVNQGTGPTREELQRFFDAALASFVDARLVRATLIKLGDSNPDDVVVRTTAQQLQLSPARQGVFRGSLYSRSPDSTIRFLNQHIQAYVHEEVQKTLRVTQAHMEFLSRQVEEKNEALLRTERELRDFKNKHLLDLPENAQGRIAGAGDLENRRGTLAAEVARLEGELRLAREQLARESPLLEAKVAAAAPYRQARDDAVRRLTQARARGLGPEHPDVQRLEREVAHFTRQVEEAEQAEVSGLERQTNPAYTELKDRVGSLQVQLVAAQQELGAVGGQLGSIAKAVAVMPEVEAEHARLTRTYQMDRELHSRLTERLRQAQVQSELDRASAEARYEVVTAPHSLGVQLRKTLLMRSGIGIALGLFVALAWGVLAELRRVIRANPELQEAMAGKTGSSRA